MTAPDDLARTLAEHRWAPHDDCRCGFSVDSFLEYEWHLAARLASVVSRRDADLRTRIEGLIAVPEADTLRAAAKRLRKGGRCAVPSKRLAALLDMQAMVVAIGGGSTVHYDDNALAIAQYILDHSPDPSRLPADTDTRSGQ